jgi:hypothetical protein
VDDIALKNCAPLTISPSAETLDEAGKQDKEEVLEEMVWRG